MNDFLPAAVNAYSTWPKEKPNYCALPAMGDAVGWVYRKDWFAGPEIQAAFKKKHNRDLAPPKNWTELREIAIVFQGREIDRKRGGSIRGEKAPISLSVASRQKPA